MLEQLLDYILTSIMYLWVLRSGARTPPPQSYFPSVEPPQAEIIENVPVQSPVLDMIEQVEQVEQVFTPSLWSSFWSWLWANLFGNPNFYYWIIGLLILYLLHRQLGPKEENCT